MNRLVWAGNSGTPTGGDHCGNAPSGTTLSPYQQSFSYDSLDRMTSGPAGSFTYGDINHVHAATSLGSMPNPYAAYDAMGNMTCRNTDTGSGHTCGSSPTGAQMTYDNEGRLAGWTAPSGTTASDGFLYDNAGNRVLQRVNSGSVTDTITFDGYTETVVSGGTTTTTKYYSVGGVRVALKTSGTLSYLLSDGLSSMTVALSSSGSTQAMQLFAPYGSVRSSQGTMPTTYNFTGQRLDSQTGLLYYGSRYYDPVSGRFAQADTVQTNAGGLDSYAYVGNNPETFSDPTGHFEDPYGGGGEPPAGPLVGASGGPSADVPAGDTPLLSTDTAPNVVVSAGTSTYNFDPLDGTIIVQTENADGSQSQATLHPGDPGYDEALRIINEQAALDTGGNLPHGLGESGGTPPVPGGQRPPTPPETPSTPPGQPPTPPEQPPTVTTNPGDSNGSGPGNYWRQSSLNDAPRTTTPGTQSISGIHVNNLGQEEPYTAYYDEYGRIIGRTDYTRGNRAEGIPPIHFHVFQWNEEFPLGFELNAHFPGEFSPDWIWVFF